MDLGTVVMIALLGAGATYGLANRGKPRSALSATRKNLALICVAIAIGCFALVGVLGLPAQQ